MVVYGNTGGVNKLCARKMKFVLLGRNFRNLSPPRCITRLRMYEIEKDFPIVLQSDSYRRRNERTSSSSDKICAGARGATVYALRLSARAPTLGDELAFIESAQLGQSRDLSRAFVFTNSGDAGKAQSEAGAVLRTALDFVAGDFDVNLRAHCDGI